ncbi:hypothetical protein LZ906_017470 (plasmid) [Paraclostridium ghonii]|uniref:hypothetical protein n=1 Tax=Paraclostridium ghonii TaxID=29358 RepID=UPI00202CC62F|nr:hypothetical protein [Paeniclostridium ghonii]MCM0166551.1 hypothetical protein [Paeniclostridium ghonii]
MKTEKYVDWKRANKLEGEIKDLENELTMATLNNRKQDAEWIKDDLRELKQELENLYWC